MDVIGVRMGWRWVGEVVAVVVVVVVIAILILVLIERGKVKVAALRGPRAGTRA